MRWIVAVVALAAAVAAVVAAVVAQSAAASGETGFEFGRIGGNIQPFTVSIAVNGQVHASGPVIARNTPLTRLQLGKLNRLVVTVGFARLAKATNCPGALPDVAATYIRVGRQTVRVHGTCVAAYQRLWAALERAAAVR
jgi:hypothetical protein